MPGTEVITFHAKVVGMVWLKCRYGFRYRKGRSMTGLLGAFSHIQLMISLSRFFSSNALPMPFTSNNSSTAVKGPLLSR